MILFLEVETEQLKFEPVRHKPKININTVTRDITYFKIHCFSGKIRQVKLQ